ncbi:MAG TPA: amidohydrolase family protein [Mycobacteriales bacterium]|jgi:predicted TIM-barrel fold metal-dependent hydrolase|nr:amidohydrolase family protein [Mycobacteriales bacterium]
MEKIWADSGDSHVLEPADLWTSNLPARLAERAPRTERDEKSETVYVDGQVVFRTLVAFAEASSRAPGADDVTKRLHDMDGEGVRGQVLFPSRGLWVARMTDPDLWRECGRIYNDWLRNDVMTVSPRLVGVAILPALSTEDAVAELQRVAANGMHAVMLPTTPPEGRDYNNPVWEPVWAAAEEADIALSFHVGTGADPRMVRGPGGAVINYAETFFPGQRTVVHLVASGALDRHPNLKVFIAEGGASWVPALADRMDEGYRQHGMYVQPKLSQLPSEIIYRQVFASFQHDKSAIPAVTAMGYQNVMWGDDYPHLEGTYGHTQQTLHELFDGVDADVAERILRGNFERLFPAARAAMAA